ncbi:MAG TPA: hypothetical protein VI299_20145 [Polyangiales bacterium]
MKIRRLIVAAALTGLVGCAGAQTAPATQLRAAQCSDLSPADREVARSEALQRVERIEPYLRRDLRTRATQQLTYTAGARLYIPAQHGWNAPYLQRVLSCHAAANDAAHSNDPFDVDGVATVSVTPNGSRYLVTIAGASREAGQQIWQRAQALKDATGHVEVRQISQQASPPTM